MYKLSRNIFKCAKTAKNSLKLEIWNHYKLKDMVKRTEEYKGIIVKTLKKAGTYSPGLDAQITALAGVLRSLALANRDIDQLETTTIETVSRYGNVTLDPHPAFKIQKDAQDAVTRQSKVLGLTPGELIREEEDDPLVDLTKSVKRATERSAKG